MNIVRISAIILIVGGVLGLVYGSFSYTHDTHDVKIGSLELSVKDKESVRVPTWAGVGAILAGAVLLLLGSRSGERGSA